MEDFISHQDYVKANLRMETLLKRVNEDCVLNSEDSQELVAVSNLIEQYELRNFPVGLPSLQEMIALRMFEMGLKRKDLALLLNTSASRISEYLNGKREITLKVAKLLHQKLNIDSDIILQ